MQVASYGHSYIRYKARGGSDMAGGDNNNVP